VLRRFGFIDDRCACSHAFRQLVNDPHRHAFLPSTVLTKTLEAIRDALIQLMEEKGFEAITIKDITAKARINRSTFYAHYQDKYHCLSSHESEFMEGIMDIARRHAAIRKTVGDSLPIAIDIFQYFYRNRDFLKVLLSPKGDPVFQSRLKQAMWDQLYERTAASRTRPNRTPISPEHVASYISGAHLSVIQYWLNNGCRESPEDMAKVLSLLTAKGPLQAAGLMETD
jgi:AcrR family transcriptional regulator